MSYFVNAETGQRVPPTKLQWFIQPGVETGSRRYPINVKTSSHARTLIIAAGRDLACRLPSGDVWRFGKTGEGFFLYHEP